MRICFIGSSFAKESGVTGPAIGLAKALVDKGADVRIVTGTQEVSSRVDVGQDEINSADDIQILRVPNLSRVLTLGKSRRTSLIESITKHSDIVHGFDFFTLYALQRGMKAGGSRTVPLVYTSTGAPRLRVRDLIDSGLPSVLNLGKSSFAFKLLCPDRLLLKMFESFDRIIPASRFMLSNLRSVGVPENKLVPIPVGIDMEQIERDSKLGRNNGTNYDFIYFGWGSSIRGVPDVLKAFSVVLKQNSEATLAMHFLGSHGVEERFYASKVRRSNEYRKKLHFATGLDPHMLSMVRGSNSVVLPFRSHFAVAQPPITVLESMSLGKAVISTHIGGVPEIISDGVNGLLVEPRDTDDLARKMLATYDEGKRISLGKRARQYVETSHDVRLIANKIISVYKAIM